MRRTLFIALFIGMCLFAPGVHAQDAQPIPSPSEITAEAVVTKIIEEKKEIPLGGETPQLYQKLELTVTSGPDKGKRMNAENGVMSMVNLQTYQPGDKLVVSIVTTFDGTKSVFITDSVRRTPLYVLFLVFCGVTVIVGGVYGFTSLLGMAASFAIIFTFILPKILAGENPVSVAITGSLFIVPVTFYLSHGFSKKSSVAVVGTVVSLMLTGILASVFVGLAKLTGFSSEEATFIQALHPGTINMRGLLLAGIIISGIGVFDDVTVSQASVVAELKRASPSLSLGGLYRRAMNVGRDHIASVVNTLVLVYAGSALPLLVLFIGNPKPFAEVVNYEFIAEEIVKTLVASIGLILAVPITTILAAVVYGKKTIQQPD